MNRITWKVAAAVGLAWMTPAMTGAATFPISGSSYTVDVIRHYRPNGTQVSSLLSFNLSNGAVTGSGSPNNLVDGEDSFWQINASPAGADADATAVAVVDMGGVYSLNSFRTRFRDGASSRVPDTYRLRLSTDNINWTEVVAPTAPGSGNVISTFAATNARYIEWTGTGIPAANAGGPSNPQLSIDNFYAFVASTSPTAPTTEQGFDVTYMSGVTVTDLTSGQWNDAPGAGDLIDKTFTGASGKAASTTDAKALIDLGAQYLLFNIALNFRSNNQFWGNGGKVEISPDGVTWVTVLDQSTSLGTSQVNFPKQYAQFVRLTNYWALRPEVTTLATSSSTASRR